MKTLLTLLFILVAGAAIDTRAQTVVPYNYGPTGQDGSVSVVHVTPGNAYDVVGPPGSSIMPPDEMNSAFQSGMGGGGGGGGDVNWNAMYFYMWLSSFLMMVSMMI